MSTETLQWFKSTYSTDEGGACLEVAYTWRKSTYSASEGGECVEVGYPWRKSTYSGDKEDACIEIAACPHTVHIRDSKDPNPEAAPTLQVTPAAWTAFTEFARS